MKKAFIIISIVFVIVLVGCSSNRLTYSKIEGLLKKKYKEDFEVYEMGRVDPFDKNSVVEASAYPISNEEIRFSVTLADDEIEDNYPAKIIGYYAKKKLDGILNDSKIDAIVIPYVHGINIDKKIEEKDYEKVISDAEVISLTFSIVTNDIKDTDKLHDLLIDYYKYYERLNSKISIGGNVYNLSSNSYNKIKGELKEKITVNKYTFRDYEMYGTGNLALMKGKENFNKEDFKKELIKNK